MANTFFDFDTSLNVSGDNTDKQKCVKYAKKAE